MQNFELTSLQLDTIADIVTNKVHDGYPELHHRLFMGDIMLQDGVVQVPDGPWHIRGHANRADKPSAVLDPEVPEESERCGYEQLTAWQSAGLATDQYGRPLHPSWRSLLSDDRIGLPTGHGMYYRYGPNTSLDVIVRRETATGNQYLMAGYAHHSGRWAMPSGYLARGEDLQSRASNIVAIKTGRLLLDGDVEIVASSRPIGSSTTLHSWEVNTIALWTPHQTGGSPELVKDSELSGSVDSQWLTEADIMSDGTFQSQRQLSLLQSVLREQQ